MKFAIDIGHNAPIGDTGAVGIRREDELTREVGQKLISLLRKEDHVVVETCPSNSKSTNYSLLHRIEVANNADVDIFISIHFNAANYKAHGVECYALSKAGRAIAQSILDEIVQLGFFNRGVKKANFFVLRNTSMPAVLVECCFCDSDRDMNLYDADSMALAIAEGLIGELPPIENQIRYMHVKQNTWLKYSTDQAKDLSPQHKQWIKQGKYRILAALPEEEGHFWVRQLNGTEGFIYAQHCEIS